jgi:hypothetical protein
MVAPIGEMPSALRLRGFSPNEHQNVVLLLVEAAMQAT